MAEKVQNSFTQKEFTRQITPMALDLMAVFNVMQDDVLKLVRKARRENWTPEQLINKIKSLIDFDA